MSMKTSTGVLKTAQLNQFVRIVLGTCYFKVLTKYNLHSMAYSHIFIAYVHFNTSFNVIVHSSLL